jgi:methionyl aminopeptidase
MLSMSLIKTKEEVAIMAEGGKILAQALDHIEAMVRPGITTVELNDAAEQFILQKGAKPAFKGFEKFPFSLCTSVNDDIVHAYPSKIPLKEGDIVGLDLGVLYKGYNTDMARTVAVGEVAFEVKRLLKATEKALRLAIKKARPGAATGDIGNTIQRFIEDQGFAVIRDLYGHGIGKSLHEDPLVPNYGKRGEGTTLKAGMVICIEPMVSMGDWHVKQSKDGYGYATRDGSLAAQFEHTLAITDQGCKILTTS